MYTSCGLRMVVCEPTLTTLAKTYRSAFSAALVRLAFKCPFAHSVSDATCSCSAQHHGCNNSCIEHEHEHEHFLEHCVQEWYAT